MSSLSKSFHNQGIGSILGSDNIGSSLRRTLSADMSSKKWQSQNGIFSPLNKIASSQELPVDSDHGLCSIQEEKNRIDKEPGQFDTWSSILSQKPKEEASNLPPPYVHQLVKRSSSLSEKSLQICTESLGSETGSDSCFSSSYPSSESSDLDFDDNKEEELQEKNYEFEGDVRSVNVMYKTKRMSPRSFPPPIPSLSCRDGTSVRVNSYRDNGRLVLEAVSVLSQNNFRASRQDGRLVLTFVDSPDGEEDQEVQHEQFEMEFERSGAAEEALDESEDVYVDVYEKAERSSTGTIYFHRLAKMVNKNTTYFNKFAKRANLEPEEEEEEEADVETTKHLTQSLPLQRTVVPRIIPLGTMASAATAAVSLNPCEFYWKPKSTATSLLNPIKDNKNNKLILSENTVATNNQQINQLQALKGIKSCKEPRMSLLFWEPHCIATS